MLLKPIEGQGIQGLPLDAEHQDEDDLKKFVNNKPSQFIPHPLYDNFGDKITKAEAREKLGIGLDEKIILFFGFIRKYKGLDILLEAMQVLKNSKFKIQNLKLLIAGEFYDDRKIYDDLINKFDIRNDLILHTDFIADSKVKYFLCAADCVVQPYRNATQSGVTPLAYHFEIPMIVTNVGSLPDLVPEGVGLVAEPDAKDIAEKIIQFFQLGEDYFLPHLREEKKKYSWSNMVNAITDLADT